MSTSSYSTSSSSSSSTSGSSLKEGTKTAVQPPRNLSRLGRTSSDPPSTSSTTTLGSSSEFKVPSLPRHHHYTLHPSDSAKNSKIQEGRRPLTMIHDPNLQPSVSISSSTPLSPRDDPAFSITSTSTSTPSRLKRLSLVARPATLLDSPQISPHTNTTPRDDVLPRSAQAQTHAHVHRTIGSLSNTTPRGTRMRGSISYSPASGSSYRPNPLSPKFPEDGLGRSSSDMERSLSGGRGSMEEHPKGETWSDRHADLLQSIAQKQRRINELKQELETEQSALYSLKQRWTHLVSSTFASPPPPNGKISSLPIHDTQSSHATSATSSASYPLSLSPTTLSQAFSFESNPTDTDRDRGQDRDRDPPGFSSLLDDVLGNAPLVDPSVVEGGKRFIGNLMRTVGAAAGGNVPSEEPAKEGSGIGGMDMSGLRGMFSWNSATRTNTVKIRPVDSVSRSTTHTPSPPPSDLMD